MTPLHPQTLLDPMREARQRGFTLIELLVAMGLLSMFLVMLVQLLATSASLFDRGERGQELADRALVAQRAVERAVGAVVGPRVEAGAGEASVDARMVVYRQGSGPIAPGASATGGPSSGGQTSGGQTSGAEDGPAPVRLPVLRATVRLRADLEQRMLRSGLEELVAADHGVEVAAVRDAADPEIAAELNDLIGSWPRRGRGEVLMAAVPAPNPAAAADGYLELRVGYRLSDPDLLGPDELALAEMVDYQDLLVDPGTLRRSTRAVASGLLHFDVELWSRGTTGWSGSGGRSGLSVWDTARAGLFLQGDVPADEEFSLDLGPDSLRDPRDDVWPRWLRITVVVAAPENATAEAMLAAPLSASDRELLVIDSGELPDPRESRFLKIGTEWVRYGERFGRRYQGLQRGVRGTVAQDHRSGSSVRGGRTLQLVMPLVGGKDADD